MTTTSLPLAALAAAIGRDVTDWTDRAIDELIADRAPALDEEQRAGLKCCLLKRAPQPGRMDLRKITAAGDTRRRALVEAEEALDVVLDELERAGDNANVSLACELAGIPRATLNRRRAARRAAAGDSVRTKPARRAKRRNTGVAQGERVGA